jgi:hypothetical protein
MNKTIFLLIFTTLLCTLITSVVSVQAVKENFAARSENKLEFDLPEAIGIIKKGKLVGVKLLRGAPPYMSPTSFRVVAVSNVRNKNLKNARIVWNADSTFTIERMGEGYVVPPEIVFVPRGDSLRQKRAEGSGKIVFTASGMWNDIPQNQKDEMAALTQDYLRSEKYTSSASEDVYLIGAVSSNNKSTYSIEWPYHIEFSSIRLEYAETQKKAGLLKINGFNDSGVSLFTKELMFGPVVEWKYTALVKKIVISGAPKWSVCKVFARRSYWTCDEYGDFVEQLNESKNKPGKSSSKFEDDDTTIVFSELLEQLPPDFRGLSKKEYVKYFSTLEGHCRQKTKEQQDADKKMEDQEIENYKNYIQEQQKKTSFYKEKLLRDYEKMVEQFRIDTENLNDAKKYGISPPEFMYTQKQIDDLKKRIESIQNIPEERLLRDCGKLEGKYNKQRRNAEKWAKASIFLPFLKKKAKRESKKAEKSENKYQAYCSELVALSYSY